MFFRIRVLTENKDFFECYQIRCRKVLQSIWPIETRDLDALAALIGDSPEKL
jgi:hypothetical protein